MEINRMQQSQDQQIAAFLGANMQEDKERQPHVNYHVYTGGSPPPPPVTAPIPREAAPIDIMAHRIRLKREAEALHQRTAAAQISVNQHVSQIEGRIREAQRIASAASASASRSAEEADATNAMKDLAIMNNATLRRQIAAMKKERIDFLSSIVTMQLRLPRGRGRRWTKQCLQAARAADRRHLQMEIRRKELIRDLSQSYQSTILLKAHPVSSQVAHKCPAHWALCNQTLGPRCRQIHLL